MPPNHLRPEKQPLVSGRSQKQLNTISKSELYNVGKHE
jgi:hypothetical protein